MNLSFHFIAIGGAVMHQLAIYLQQQGNRVSGSDDVIFDPALTQLQNNNLLPPEFGWFPEKIDNGIDAIILGMHAKTDNPELLKAQSMGIPVYSFPEFIYNRSIDKRRIVIAGSHGKTSITSIVMHILKDIGIDFDYLVGSRIEGFDTMVKISPDAEIIIIEGDEYLSSAIDNRSKFLHYRPDTAVVSGIAWDHINVFPTFEAYLDTFRQFIATIAPNGTLFYYQNDQYLQQMTQVDGIDVQGYAAFQSTEINGQTIILLDGREFPVQIFGQHNMENMMAAALVCKTLSITIDESLGSMESFKGSANRLELIDFDTNLNRTIFRDFAHAPSKLKASLAALRSKYKDEKIVGVFELHTYSSLQPEFLLQYMDSMSKADVKAIFLDEHALKIKGKDDIADDKIITAFNDTEITIIRTADELESFINNSAGSNSVLAMMSSGNFGGLNMQQIKSEE